jgi:hypothetical protein
VRTVCLRTLVSWYSAGYTLIVKTAISIPQELFETGEEFARERVYVAQRVVHDGIASLSGGAPG